MYLRRLLPRAALPSVLKTALSCNRRCVHSAHSHLLKGPVVRIACASGFWGDSSVAGLFTADKLEKIVLLVLVKEKEGDNVNVELGVSNDSVHIKPYYWYWYNKSVFLS